MSEQSTAIKLLQETLNLFRSLGVVTDKGTDGQLMSKIIAELEMSAVNAPPRIEFNPNVKQACPLCRHPDFNECGCPADEQMAAMV